MVPRIQHEPVGIAVMIVDRLRDDIGGWRG
jgi:hypothetical protein